MQNRHRGSVLSFYSWGWNLLAFVVVVITGFVVGTINGMAGGASLISFPVLLALGLNPVSATVTNALGVTSANLFAVRASDHSAKALIRQYKFHIALSATFACLGAILLLALPSKVFEGVVPYLLLGATLTILLPAKARSGMKHKLTEFIAIAASGFYCGYFGPGQGVMVIATLARDEKRDPNTVNAVKNVIVGVTSIISNTIYIFSGRVHWLLVVALFIGSSSGGTLGGKWANKMPPSFYKSLVFAVGIIASVWLFVRN